MQSNPNFPAVLTAIRLIVTNSTKHGHGFHDVFLLERPQCCFLQWVYFRPQIVPFYSVDEAAAVVVSGRVMYVIGAGQGNTEILRYDLAAGWRRWSRSGLCFGRRRHCAVAVDEQVISHIVIRIIVLFLFAILCRRKFLPIDRTS